MCRYERSDEDEDVDHTTQASFWKNIKEILTQIFNFRRLKSPTTLSGGIVAWEVFLFCEYMVCSSAFVLVRICWICRMEVENNSDTNYPSMKNYTCNS
jgi:hypothetical protein